MRSIRVDQYEFDDPDSEESLELDISCQSHFPHPDVRSFAGAVIDAALAEPQPFSALAERRQVSEYLKRFAELEVPAHADWPTYKIADESWDEVHLIICMPGVFVRYYWSTSA